MSTAASYFEEMYRRGPDPWGLGERWYEHRKYDLTLAALPRPRYRSAFEPGCSVGELTARLAVRCEAVLACDRIPGPVATAAHRNSAHPHVSVRELVVPDQWPDGSFDLIVLSELLYYFDEPHLHRLLERALSALEPGGTLVTAHWNHPVAEHLRTGDEIAGTLAELPGLTLMTDLRDADFVLQIHGRQYGDGSSALSPAAAEGLV
ncbi:SAM-dependent methyltransferase [Streptomyces sp. NPDC058391]|uniref:SAM-dependent methyltransferase n=1 Tax=Streptomyces sp. NPDC058391 TaxID=3346476 RepID=UPI00364C59F9